MKRLLILEALARPLERLLSGRWRCGLRLDLPDDEVDAHAGDGDESKTAHDDDADDDPDPRRDLAGHSELY